MNQGALDMGSTVSIVLRKDVIVPHGDDVRGEFGGGSGGNRLDDAVNVNDVGFDPLHIWLDGWVGKCLIDEGVRVWFYDVAMCCGNGVAD